jgi:hypothetical protein
VFAVVCILYTFFGGSPAREADKTGIFLKKILRFVGSPTNIGAPWGRCGWSALPCGSYVHRGTDKHKANMAQGWSRDYVAYVHWPGGTDECKGLRFIGSAWPMNVSYVRRP